MKMQEFANSPVVILFLAVLGCVVCAANVYLIYALFFNGGFISSVSNDALRILFTVIVVVIGVIYFISLGYLLIRPIRVAEDYSKASPESEALLSEGKV